RSRRLAVAQRIVSASRKLLGRDRLTALGSAAWIRHLPLVGAWARTRDLPVPPPESFRSWWSRTHPEEGPGD
ncbi:MAG TPA: (4Fe-4S)-binding protein, partial [Streptosporangiaceae bacterium]